MRRYLDFAGNAKVLIATFAGTILFTFAVFPSIPIGGESLDTLPGYDFGEVVQLMELYGQSGRRLYAWASPTLDTLFTLVYVTFLAGTIYRFRPKDALYWLAFLPVVAGIADLGENVQVTAMLLQFPDLSQGQVAAASLFTQAKHVLLGAALLAALALLTLAAARYPIRKFRS